MSTFTLPKHYEGVPGEDMLHFGVGMLYIITENQKLVLQYLQSVTFAIVSRCFENKNNNCCVTKQVKNAICLFFYKFTHP